MLLIVPPPFASARYPATATVAALRSACASARASKCSQSRGGLDEPARQQAHAQLGRPRRRVDRRVRDGAQLRDELGHRQVQLLREVDGADEREHEPAGLGDRIDGLAVVPAADPVLGHPEEIGPVRVDAAASEDGLQRAARPQVDVVVRGRLEQPARRRELRGATPALVGEAFAHVVAGVRRDYALDQIRPADEEEVAATEADPGDVALLPLQLLEEPDRVAPEAADDTVPRQASPGARAQT
jgi:hypothetical protein